MAYPKFFEFCTNKKELARKPKIMKVKDRVTGSDDIDGSVNTTPKTVGAMAPKGGKAAQVKEAESKGLGNLFGDNAPAAPLAASGAKTGSLRPTTGNQGQPANYRGPGKDPGQKSVEGNIGVGGLGNQGDTKYSPSTTKGDSPYIPGGTTSKTTSWESKTEAFLSKTKDMPLGKFAKYMLQKECSGFPAEIIQSVTDMAKENNKVTKELILEMKRKGLLKKALKEMLLFPEAHAALASLLTDNKTANAFARAINEQYVESVGPPIGFEGDEDGMGGDEDANAEDMGDEDMDDMDDSDEFGDEDPDEDEFDDDEDDEDLDSDEVPEDEYDDDSMEMGDEEGAEDEDGAMMGPPPGRQQTPLAFDHVMNALSKYQSLWESKKRDKLWQAKRDAQDTDAEREADAIKRSFRGARPCKTVPYRTSRGSGVKSAAKPTSRPATCVKEE